MFCVVSLCIECLYCDVCVAFVFSAVCLVVLRLCFPYGVFGGVVLLLKYFMVVSMLFYSIACFGISCSLSCDVLLCRDVF